MMFFVLWWLQSGVNLGRGGKGEVPQVPVVIFFFSLFLLVLCIFFLGGESKLKIEGNYI